jgi:hypothetical protein
MAFTVINTSDTLEQMRVKLNNLTTNDFGDPANLLGAGLSSTSIVGAVVEIAGVAFSAAGWTIRDSSSTIQVVGAGQTLDVRGTSNQITAVVSSPDTLTLALTSNVTIPGNFIAGGDITAGGNITASGTTHTLGTVQISGNTIRSIDSSRININDTFRATALETTTGLFVADEFTGVGIFPRIRSTRADKIFIFDALPLFNSSIAFEGSSADDFETTITVTNPTADRTITIPDITGTLITTADTGTVTVTMLAGSITGGKLLDDAITEAKIADDAVGQDQLKSVVNLQILNSSGGILKSIYGAGA